MLVFVMIWKYQFYEEIFILDLFSYVILGKIHNILKQKIRKKYIKCTYY